MARVFISHATADLARAVEVCDWLHGEGHDPFLDQDPSVGIQIGEDWRQRLYQELRQADAVVCVVTSAFVASPWCAAEVGIADALGCRLLPLHMEHNVRRHPLMERLQYVDYEADPVVASRQLGSVLRGLDIGGRTTSSARGKPLPESEPPPGLTEGNGTEIRWDVTNPAQPRSLGSPSTAPRGRVYSLAYSPNRNIDATASPDNTVLLWDVTDPARPRSLGPPLTGHGSGVSTAEFAHEGRILATGSDDGTVILWDVTGPAPPPRPAPDRPQ